MEMCFYCGAIVEEPFTWKSGRRVFCSQKCINKYVR